MKRFVLILLLSLLLSGCSFVERLRDSQKTLTQDPQDEINQLIEQRRYREAIRLLQHAIDQGWESDSNKKRLEETLKQQNSYEFELESWLLIERTRSMVTQLALLEKLALAKSSYKLSAEIDDLRNSLKHNRKPLSDCGWAPELREETNKTCLLLAVGIEPDDQDQRKLDSLLNREKVQENERREKKAKAQLAEQQQEKTERAKAQLVNAKALYENNNLREAKRELTQVLNAEPGNAEAQQLLKELDTRLQGHLNYLLAAGDRLYREGDIAGARALWQSALNLDPEDERIIEKLDRANRVLNNLEVLRKSK